MKKLFIIILNFNGGKKILACLKSLYLAEVPSGWQLNVIVVDNSSNDNSLDLIKKSRFKGMRILKNRKNLGFAEGNNVGIKEALKNKVKMILLLNQDTIVNKDFLLPLLLNSADIVAPVIKFKRHDRWVYDFGGRINWWLGRTRHVEKIFPPGADQPLAGNFQSPNIVYISGCAMLIKKKVFERIGLLDERYFLYFEDVDFCLRAEKAGFKIAVEPKTVIWHQLEETESKSYKQNWSLLKSNLIFINCYVNWWRKPVAYLYWLFISVRIFLG